MSVPLRTRWLGAAAVGALTVLPAACGGGDEDAAGSGPSATPTSVASPTPTMTATAPESGASSPPGEGASVTPTGPAAETGQTRTALVAIATAQQAVAGGRVFDLESDADRGGRWEAKVAVGADRQVSLRLSVDGKKVLGQREDKTPDDDLKKVQAAPVRVERAVHVAAERAGGEGELSALEIDTSDSGVLQWQVDFGGDDGLTVLVDAKTAKVLDVGADVG